MKRNFFFLILFVVGALLSMVVFAAPQTFSIRGFFSPLTSWVGGHAGPVLFTNSAAPNPTINQDGYLAGSFWLGNVGWTTFDHGTPTVAARVVCPDNIFTNTTQPCPVIGDAWSKNAGWIVLSGSSIGGGSQGVYFDPTTGQMNGWGWNLGLGWVPVISGINTPDNDPTTSSGVTGVAINFIGKIAVVGNIAGSRVFTVANNGITNQDVGYSYQTINHADLFNTIRKNISLISRNVSDMMLASQSSSLNFIIEKSKDYILDNGWSMPMGKRTIIVIGHDVVINQASIGQDTASTPAIIVLKDTSGNGGNIIITSKVKQVYSYLYAEGSIYSGEKSGNTITPYTNAGVWSIPANQLYIRGSVVSKNTIGGSQQVPPVCPVLINNCTAQSVYAYDMDYFRTYDQLDTSQKSLPSWLSSISSLKSIAMVIEYDPRLLSDPPPGLAQAY